MDKNNKHLDTYEKMKNRKSEVKIVRRIVLIVTLVVLLIVAIGGFSIYSYVSSALEPVNPESIEQIDIEIPMGSGVTLISTILEENGIVKDAQIFKYYAKFKNESQFQAGSYTMAQSMTLDEIIESLKTGKVYREPVFAMTVPEGLTLEQIAGIVEKNTVYSSKEFMDRVTNQAFIEELMTEYPDLLTDAIFGENIRYALEGYLFPATYSYFEEKPPLDDIIRDMLTATNNLLTEFGVIASEEGVSVHEFLTFASLLEEEATAKTDRETIASVFYNRLEIDMPLQTDPTVLYALGSHKDRVLYEDLEVENAYNTYKNKGLPPGPIAGAGKTSMEAALNPTKTEYFYFLADKEGTNHFAKTYDEHLANIEEYLR
ncbi:MAG: endolytic transglycosylase MltG [Solibacillus sp.]